MKISDETIEEMRAEGLDILVTFWKEHPDERTQEAMRHYSKEWGALVGLPGTVIVPHPVMMGVARELARKS